jgi:hypothetical protein
MWFRNSCLQFQSSISFLCKHFNQPLWKFFRTYCKYFWPGRLNDDWITYFIKQITTYTYYPSCHQVYDVAKAIIQKFPYLCEKIGSGYDGWYICIRFRNSCLQFQSSKSFLCKHFNQPLWTIFRTYCKYWWYICIMDKLKNVHRKSDEPSATCRKKLKMSDDSNKCC